ncbi:MAG: CHAT domain-containing tetratricopeptide repeat protein [Bacteroidota bacterium]
MFKLRIIGLLIFSSVVADIQAQDWLNDYNQSLEFYNNDQLEDALNSCQQAHIKYKREGDLDHGNYRAILRQLSVIHFSLNNIDQAEELAENEVESWRSASKFDESSYIDALDNLGMILAAASKYKEAEKTLLECYNSVKISAKSDVEKAIIEGHLAEVLYANGKNNESAEHFQSSLAILDQLDEIPADYLNFCYSYGSLCTELDKPQEAINYLSMLFQWYEETEPDPIIISTNISLGTAYSQAGNLALGEKHYSLAKKALEQTGAEQFETTEVIRLLALNIEQQGRHAEAEEMMASISKDILNNGEASEKQALFINSQATIQLHNGKVFEALEMYSNALKMLESLQLQSGESYATIGLNEVKAHEQAGNLIEANELASHLISLQDTERIVYFLLVAELGTVLQKQADYENAEQQYAIIKSADRSAWPAIEKARILNKTASFYQVRGDYSISGQLYNEAKSSLTPESDIVLYQSLSFNHITLLQAMGNIEEAQQLLNELKSSVGTDNPEIYLGILRNLGGLSQSKGDYQSAEKNYNEALNLAKTLYGGQSSQYADILLRLATLDKDLGHYQIAEPRFLEVSKIIASEQGTKHPNYASVDNNIGILYQQMGNYSKAEEKFQEAISIYEAAYGKESPDYVLSLENLATLYELKGDKDKALAILATTLEANKKIYGENNPNYAVSMHNYASLLQKTDRKDEAYEIFEQVLVLQEKSIGKIQPSYASTLQNLAVLAQEQGKYEIAESLINETLDIRKKLFDKSHPSYTSALYSKAVLMQVTEQYDKAWEIYNQVIDQYLDQIDKYFPSLSEMEKNAFYAKAAPVINRYKEFCLEYYINNNQSSEAINRLYDVQLATKALLLNAVNKTRNRILTSGNQKLIEDFNSWTNMKKQLVKYYSFNKEEIAAQGINIKQLEEEVNTLEKALSSSSELFASEFDKVRPTWQQVTTALSQEEAAIEIIRIERNGAQDSVTYAAMALHRDSQYPEIVTLPLGAQMEEKYYKFYKNTVKYHVHDKRSFRVYWKEIDDLIDDVKTIYFSPDGVYNKVNINTIFNVKTDQYLIEDYFVKYLSSTRDLINHKEKGVAESPSILCLGNPNYDLNGPVNVPATLNEIQRSQLNMNRISPLPGTKKEISFIDSLLTVNSWQVHSYLEGEATEKKVKMEEASNVIHLATHGFFMADLGISEIEERTGHNEFEKNPLFRSGLLFAGASNLIKDTDNDGILTAYEAMNLYLDNTELVVLSACETALGDVKNGEGVYGLQRALQVAGAQKLVMSLWKVNDEATMQLMRYFYTNWIGGEDIYNAMQKAQIAMLHEHEEPYYWGAFIMIGK